eukprot:TRINITY_DN753_c0_g5_i1.p1 TRINITY_DN753_c0_g5~~TRINITY_DN753_c0_g5_i1.p1  ORF type:complete len:295 (+),score=51.37 TRINITY_DN753_c0_g5_i1:75-959(+)
MSLRLTLLPIAVLASLTPATALPTVLVTGATGETGALTYKALKSVGGFNVRAFLRNATKAKAVLGCEKCDETEGIFVGNLDDPKSVINAMKGVDKLVIATAAVAKCTGSIPIPPFGSCKYYKGAFPVDIDWKGTKVQVKAFASNGVNGSKHIAFVSSGGTESPNNILNKIGNGQILFYKLNAEAFIMSSGLPFTIVKPCGLSEGAAGKKKLVVGHDSKGFPMALDHSIQRADVVRVIVESLRKPEISKGLRFDLCSQAWGKPTTDIENDVLKASMYPWDSRRETSEASEDVMLV